ncbi:MAG: hypothetical protein Q4F58_00270 [Candidatus Saccharibacteria bacterium]|nr:hypothetical protein [Candidatus Saccharibacteria bacterium]
MSGEKKDIDMGELAKAFDAEATEPKKTSEEKKDLKMSKEKKKTKKNKKAIAVFVVGLLVLLGGLGFLIYKLVAGPAKADAEFLISNGEWVEEDEPSVIWKFTEVGKGTLTTDGHQTDYDFIWSLDNGKIKMETKWLYDLTDEFEYSLDQGSKTLTLKKADKNLEVKFKAQDN